MKKSIIPVAAFIAGMAIVPSVFADTTLTLKQPTENTQADVVYQGAEAETGDTWKNAGAVTEAEGIFDYSIYNNGELGDYSDITIEYSDLTLNYAEGDADQHRPAGYAWLGFKLEAADHAVTNSAKFTYTIRDNEPVEADLYDENGTNYSDEYTVGVDKAFLEAHAAEGKVQLAKFEFDWDGDDTIDQTVRMIIDTSKVNLYELATDEYGQVSGVAEEPSFTPEIAAEIAGGDTDETENPDTADTIATYLTIATVALLGLGATAFVAKKSNR